MSSTSCYNLLMVGEHHSSLLCSEVWCLCLFQVTLFQEMWFIAVWCLVSSKNGSQRVCMWVNISLCCRCSCWVVHFQNYFIFALSVDRLQVSTPDNLLLDHWQHLLFESNLWKAVCGQWGKSQCSFKCSCTCQFVMVVVSNQYTKKDFFVW